MPFSRKWGHPVPALAVSDWNKRLHALATSFSLAHPDATVFHFDAHALFNQVIDDPNAYPQTQVYKHTADNCEEYHSASQKDDWNEICGIELERYLWHDALHPTTAVHDAMAAQVAQMLDAGLHVGAR